jgi:hypothetical protein
MRWTPQLGLLRQLAPSLLVGALAVFLLATLGGAQEIKGDGMELWMVSMPLGYELDVQRTRSGWAVFWMTPDGASTRVAGWR